MDADEGETKCMVQVSGTGAEAKKKTDYETGRKSEGGERGASRHLGTVLINASHMQVFLVEEMHLAREVRPISTAREFPAQAFHVTCSTLVRELHLPTTEIV